MSRRGSQPERLPGVWTLIRDILSFLGGWALIFLEAQRPEVRGLVMLVGGAAIGIPGFAVGAASVAEVISQRRGGTPDSPSPRVEPRV